jgi:cation:H+ antiporter
MTILAPWLKFAGCVLVTSWARRGPTQYADVIARLTGLSRSWISFVT